MVESDGKLTDVNFYQTEKSVCGRRTTRRKTAQKKKPTYQAGSVAV